jgi:hypothetical protein
MGPQLFERVRQSLMRYGARGVQTQGFNTCCHLLPSKQRSVTLETVICEQTLCRGLIHTFFHPSLSKVKKVTTQDEAFKDLYLHKTSLLYVLKHTPLKW